MLAGVALVVVLGACGADNGDRPRVAAGPAPTAPSTTSGSTSTLYEPVAPPYEASAPVLNAAAPKAVTIGAIGVSSSLVDLGLQPDGTLQVPVDFDQAGWYTGGPRPGETGPAVIAGHVDSTSGPAVFYRLRDLAPGDEISVEREDGSVAVFVVQRSQSFPKDTFPTDVVFGPAIGPELRLVTCTGAFDRGARSYLDNLVVFATLRP